MKKSKGSPACWSLSGIVLILTAVLFGQGCCPQRHIVTDSRTEQQEQITETERTDSQSVARQEVTQNRQTEGVTVTEIEIYDTTQPTDPETGTPPVKARVRQRHEQSGSSHQVKTTEAATTTETARDLLYDGGTLDEVTVTATREPSLWERIKKGAAWASALIVLAAAGWIIYKLKK